MNWDDYTDFKDFCKQTGMQPSEALEFLKNELEKVKEKREELKNDKHRNSS